MEAFSRFANPLDAKPFSTLGKLRNWAKVGFCEIYRKFYTSLTIYVLKNYFLGNFPSCRGIKM